MTKHACGKCIDNGAIYQLEVRTVHGTTTGAVHLCWPCFEQRINDLMFDLDPTVVGERIGGVAGFTVTR